MKKFPGNGHPTTPGGQLATDETSPATDDRPPLIESDPVSRLLKQARFRCLASALSGLPLFACFPKLDWNLLVWAACFPLLAAVVSEPVLARAFFLAYLTGVIFLAGSCYWFVIVTERYGGLSPGLAVGVLLLFAIVFSVIFGAFGLVEAWVARRSRLMALALSPFLWVSLELARTYFLTGVPWNLLGYAVQSTGLSQLASVTAVYGLSFLAVATSALLASALLAGRARWSWSIPAFWFVLLIVINSAYRPPMSPPESEDAYLLQPDVPLDEAAAKDWSPSADQGRHLGGLVNASLAAACKGFPAHSEMSMPDCSGPRSASLAPRPLIVWSENPAPFYFTRDPEFQASMVRMAERAHAYVVFNTITFAGPDDAQPKNSAIVLGPDGRVALQYDKIHLVPFGEYVPPWAFPGKVGKITSQAGDFVPGTSYRAAETPDGAIAVPICYEDIFPQLVRRLTPQGPGVLVNISNDSWYGDSSAAFQHLEMSRYRAIENGRYLLRATNDGITAIIDPHGRVIEQLPRHRRMVLSGHFNYVGRQTFYNAHGDVFAWLCVLATVAVVGSQVRRGIKGKA